MKVSQVIDCLRFQTKSSNTGDPSSDLDYEARFKVALIAWARGKGHVQHPWIDKITSVEEQTHRRDDALFRVISLIEAMTGSKLRPVGDNWTLTVSMLFASLMLLFHMMSPSSNFPMWRELWTLPNMPGMKRYLPYLYTILFLINAPPSQMPKGIKFRTCFRAATVIIGTKLRKLLLTTADDSSEFAAWVHKDLLDNINFSTG